MFEADNTAAERFKQCLRQLSSSRESIQHATKILMDNVAESEDLFPILMKRLRKMSAKRRLPLFYLVDSVCQVSKSKQHAEYRELTAKYLIEILQLVVPEEGEARNKAYPTVTKVLGLWKERKVFNPELLKRARRKIEPPEKALEDPVIRRDRSFCTDMSTEEIMKHIEEWRRNEKKNRWESALRPENDKPNAEFEEEWERFHKQETMLSDLPKGPDPHDHRRPPLRRGPVPLSSISDPSDSDPNNISAEAGRVYMGESEFTQPPKPGYTVGDSSDSMNGTDDVMDMDTSLQQPVIARSHLLQPPLPNQPPQMYRSPASNSGSPSTPPKQGFPPFPFQPPESANGISPPIDSPNPNLMGSNGMMNSSGVMNMGGSGMMVMDSMIVDNNGMGPNLRGSNMMGMDNSQAPDQGNFEGFQQGNYNQNPQFEGNTLGGSMDGMNMPMSGMGNNMMMNNNMGMGNMGPMGMNPMNNMNMNNNMMGNMNGMGMNNMMGNNMGMNMNMGMNIGMGNNMMNMNMGMNNMMNNMGMMNGMPMGMNNNMNNNMMGNNIGMNNNMAMMGNNMYNNNNMYGFNNSQDGFFPPKNDGSPSGSVTPNQPAPSQSTVQKPLPPNSKPSPSASPAPSPTPTPPPTPPTATPTTPTLTPTTPSLSPSPMKPSPGTPKLVAKPPAIPGKPIALVAKKPAPPSAMPKPPAQGLKPGPGGPLQASPRPPQPSPLTAKIPQLYPPGKPAPPQMKGAPPALILVKNPALKLKPLAKLAPFQKPPALLKPAPSFKPPIRPPSQDLKMAPPAKPIPTPTPNNNIPTASNPPTNPVTNPDVASNTANTSNNNNNNNNDNTPQPNPSTLIPDPLQSSSPSNNIPLSNSNSSQVLPPTLRQDDTIQTVDMSISPTSSPTSSPSLSHSSSTPSTASTPSGEQIQEDKSLTSNALT